MNVTNASASHRTIIYQCGTDLSGSLGYMNFTIIPYVIQGNACTALNGTRTATECLASLKGYVFYIQPGEGKVRMYSRHAILEVPEGGAGKCSVQEKGSG